MAGLWPWSRNYRGRSKELTVVGEELAKKPLQEQIEWCLGMYGKPGVIAVIFGIEGYAKLRPVVMKMLTNPDINIAQRGDIARAIIESKPGVVVISQMLRMVKHSRLHSYDLESSYDLKSNIIDGIVSSRPDQKIIDEMKQMAKHELLDKKMRDKMDKAIAIMEVSRPLVPTPSAHEASSSHSAADVGSSQPQEGRGQEVQFREKISLQEKQLTKSIKEILNKREKEVKIVVDAVVEDAEFEVMKAVEPGLPSQSGKNVIKAFEVSRQKKEATKKNILEETTKQLKKALQEKEKQLLKQKAIMEASQSSMLATFAHEASSSRGAAVAGSSQQSKLKKPEEAIKQPKKKTIQEKERQLKQKAIMAEGQPPMPAPFAHEASSSHSAVEAGSSQQSELKKLEETIKQLENTNKELIDQVRKITHEKNSLKDTIKRMLIDFKKNLQKKEALGEETSEALEKEHQAKITVTQALEEASRALEKERRAKAIVTQALEEASEALEEASEALEEERRAKENMAKELEEVRQQLEEARREND